MQDHLEALARRRYRAIAAKLQQSSFLKGPETLPPLRMADVAGAMGVHESTVSRIVREKISSATRGYIP